MPEPIIQLVGVSVRFGRQQVLSDIHLDVFAHETLALIGESGCGKSVTLKPTRCRMATISRSRIARRGLPSK